MASRPRAGDLREAQHRERNLNTVLAALVLLELVALAAFVGYRFRGAQPAHWRSLGYAELPQVHCRTADGRATTLSEEVRRLGRDQVWVSFVSPSCRHCIPYLSVTAAAGSRDSHLVVIEDAEPRETKEQMLELAARCGRPLLVTRKEMHRLPVKLLPTLIRLDRDCRVVQWSEGVPPPSGKVEVVKPPR